VIGCRKKWPSVNVLLEGSFGAPGVFAASCHRFGETCFLLLLSLLSFVALNFVTTLAEIENNEMDGACSAFGGRGEAYTGFWWGNLRERDYLGDPGIDGRMILRWIIRK